MDGTDFYTLNFGLLYLFKFSLSATLQLSKKHALIGKQHIIKNFHINDFNINEIFHKKKKKKK
jgi:hypothetical protein